VVAIRLNVGDFIIYRNPNDQGAGLNEKGNIAFGRVIGEYPSFYLINLGRYRDTIHKNDLKLYRILKIGRRSTDTNSLAL
jgi:hypothetical protein